MRNQPVIVEQKINAPLERVWKAVTEREEMRHWYFDITRFWPELGFDFQFNEIKGDKKYVHLCRITHLIEKRKISYSWRYENIQGTSDVTFELISADKETIVKLKHSGVDSFKDASSDFSRAKFEKMWNRLIKHSLKDFAEREIINTSVTIQADPSYVWQVLTDLDYIPVWMNMMGKTIVVQSDWREDSSVIWTNTEGDVVAEGVVTVNHPEHYLKVCFPCYDKQSCALNPGEDYQIYMITGISMDQCLLEVECNTFSENTVQLKMFWERALKKIKQLSEKIGKDALIMVDNDVF